MSLTLFLLLLGVIGAPRDAELVARFQSGDADAFTEIVRRYQHRVFTLAVRWMGDPRVAEEVSQDVFIALYRALGGFRGDSSLSTWVYRVVINHCKNRRLYRMRRAADRHEPLEGNPRDDDGPERQLAHDGPGTDAGLMESEASAIVHEALDTLDEQQRHIILLRDVEDMSYEEIADLLGLPRGTVKSRLHRARAQLATVLSKRLNKDDVL